MKLLRDLQCPRSGGPQAVKTSGAWPDVGSGGVPRRLGGRAASALVLCGLLATGCGGGPEVVSEGSGDPAITAAPPNPEVANPCAAPAIDPGLNPCAGVSGPAPAGAGDGPAPAPGAAPTP